MKTLLSIAIVLVFGMNASKAAASTCKIHIPPSDLHNSLSEQVEVKRQKKIYAILSDVFSKAGYEIVESASESDYEILSTVWMDFAHLWLLPSNTAPTSEREAVAWSEASDEHITFSAMVPTLSVYPLFVRPNGFAVTKRAAFRLLKKMKEAGIHSESCF